MHIRKYLSSENAKALGNAFYNSQFNYVLMIWMFCKKTIYLKNHMIHHKTLKVIYQPYTSYEDLLELCNSVSIHQTCSFYLGKYIKALLMQNPTLYSPSLRTKKFHIILGGVQCFSFFLQGQPILAQALSISADC